MKKIGILKVMIGMLLIVILVALVGGSFYFYDFAFAKGEKSFLKSNPDLESGKGSAEAGSVGTGNKYEWFDNDDFETIELTSEDGLKLKGYYLEAKEPVNRTAILAHGYTSRGREMVTFGKLFYEKLGYNVLIADNRGHGESEGDYIGFGWRDRLDYLQWINYVINKNGNDVQIVLFGVSMGGATVLMTSGEEMPENVKAVISDCAYTSVQDELAYHLKRMFHLPPFPYMYTTSIITKIKAGYYIGEASALKQVKKSVTPTLFIHGEADTFVPYEMVYELYESCSSEKELFTVPDAGHGTSYRVDEVGYETVVEKFLSKYVIQ